MTETFVAWAVSATVMIALAVVLGGMVNPPGRPWGILVDSRGRFSLTHFQLVTWSIVIISLISGIFWGRLLGGVDDPLGFSLPSEVLGLIGISVGAGVASGVVKSSKDARAGTRIAASDVADPPRFGQMFLLEEGEFADRVVDITKFQNFIFTLILVVAYVALSIETIGDAESAAAISGLPAFSPSFLTLLGISHAAHVVGKIPDQSGSPPGLTVANRQAVAEAMPAAWSPRNT